MSDVEVLEESTSSATAETPAPSLQLEILPVILDGTFFTVISRDTKNNITAKCNLCPKSKSKPHNGSITSTTNFLNHLKVGSELVV
jgi:hypothetical protein